MRGAEGVGGSGSAPTTQTSRYPAPAASRRPPADPRQPIWRCQDIRRCLVAADHRHHHPVRGGGDRRHPAAFAAAAPPPPPLPLRCVAGNGFALVDEGVPYPPVARLL